MLAPTAPAARGSSEADVGGGAAALKKTVPAAHRMVKQLVSLSKTISQTPSSPHAGNPGLAELAPPVGDVQSRDGEDVALDDRPARDVAGVHQRVHRRRR